MLQKLLFSSSLAALIFCSPLSPTHAMDGQDQEKWGFKRAFTSISKTPSVAEELQKIWFPLEVWGVIIENVVKGSPQASYDLLCTSKDLGQITKLTMTDLSRWKLNLTEEILAQWTHITRLDLGGNPQITDKGLKGLTNLTDLHLNGEVWGGGRMNVEKNTNITWEGVKNLSGLKLSVRTSLAQDFIRKCWYGSRSSYQKGLQCNDWLSKKLFYLNAVFYLEQLDEELQGQLNGDDSQFLNFLERELCALQSAQPATHTLAFNPFFATAGNGFNGFATLNTSQQVLQNDNEWDFLSD